MERINVYFIKTYNAQFKDISMFVLKTIKTARYKC